MGPDDPNRSVGGARRRLGPFWIEEPAWFWAAWAVLVVAGVALFVLAMSFDHP